MVRTEQILTGLCEDCETDLIYNEDEIKECMVCGFILCSSCFSSHVEECCDKDADESQLNTAFRCDECGQIYDNPEEAEECCEEEE